MARTKIIGYGPDQDQTTPGVLVDCEHAVPSLRGMIGAPGVVNGLLPALAAACVGATSIRKLDDTTRVFAGTSTKLYEASTSSWTDRSAGGGSYTAITAGYRWSFAQYGNVSLAVNKTNALQFSTTGAFAAATAPKASIVETVGQFAFLFDTDEATYGDSPDRWWCSASGNYADWVPSVATECATGRLISAPGPIRAAKRFGEQVVVYKGRGMFVGTYQGAPEVWRFDEVPSAIGTVSNEAVVDIGTVSEPMHIFMGFDDFYTFSGGKPVAIGVGWVKDAVFSELTVAQARLCCTAHDPVNSRVYFFYPSTTTLNKCVVYNYKTKQWGRDDRDVECVLAYASPGITYTDMGTYYATYGTPIPLSYDAAFLVAGSAVPAIFNTAHLLQSLTGISVASSITTGDAGDEDAYTLINKVRPLFLTAPITATLTNYHKKQLGDTLTTDQTVSIGDGKFDVLRSARWHRLKFDMTGDWEMAHFNVYGLKEGDA